jgi:hypothetical protein
MSALYSRTSGCLFSMPCCYGKQSLAEAIVAQAFAPLKITFRLVMLRFYPAQAGCPAVEVMLEGEIWSPKYGGQQGCMVAANKNGQGVLLTSAGAYHGFSGDRVGEGSRYGRIRLLP